MEGQSLGGSSSSSSSSRPLTQEEMRQRRLASLSAASGNTVSTVPPTTTTTTLVSVGGPKQAPPNPPSTVTASAAQEQPPAAAAAQQQPLPTLPSSLVKPSPLNKREGQQQQQRVVVVLEDDDGDAGLQAALALSMQKDASVSGGGGGGADLFFDAKPSAAGFPATVAFASGSDHDVMSMHVDTNVNNDTPHHYHDYYDDHVDHDDDDDGFLDASCPDYTTEPLNISAFHDLMWDTNLTTENDKSRWVSQGIDVRTSGDDSSNKAVVAAAATVIDFSYSTYPAYASTMLDKIALSHIPWGLQQQHGGPCGVMAAIQAEVLRLLIWGTKRKIRQQQDSTTTTTTIISLDYPQEVPNDANAAESNVAISPHLVRQALARAIALVLARATLTPPAFCQDDSSTNANHAATAAGEAAGATSPAVTIHHPTTSTTEERSNKDCVRIAMPIRPKRRMGLTWEDLEPWTTTTMTAAAKNNPSVSQALRIYTITAPPAAMLPDAAAAAAASTTTPKRQKVTTTMAPCDESSSSLETRIVRLARIVARFLLQPFHKHQQQQQQDAKNTELEYSDDDDDNKAATNPPRATVDDDFLFLDAFCREGGVLLLVMSLVACRGKDVIQREFDDPVGTKLTSQFGHCGQELINLLLTGQAVSNVFDNTMTLSGDVICRGIQVRPAIGYLSQLESMRYCEVGGYYKSPRFPVWVVGSTSHFTVLFAQAEALKESTSDLLLEQCRREFKAVEGGDENGFIATDQLGTVLKNLNVNVGGDDRVQTLAATLEVSGAGIILWDDFWKACSRLMSGVTLETLLQQDDDLEPPPLIYNVDTQPLEDPGNMNNNMDIQKPVARYPAAAASVGIESDEEMARRLNEEWKKEGAASGIVALRDADFSKGSFPLGRKEAPSVVEPASLISATTTPLLPVAAAATARIPSPMQVEPTISSDEALARKLQEEWNAEISGLSPSADSVIAVAGNASPTLAGRDNDVATLSATPPPRLTPPIDEDMKPAAKSEQQQQKLEFERFGDSFGLYHYNGLRGGVLTPFRITRLSAEEAVGASIALNRGANGSSHSSDGSGDLEDVVRTKWPSCIVDWNGIKPPYID